jgi:tetratricopeptide (TPR) repeat protein/predicted amidophosphoribosyltransferase
VSFEENDAIARVRQVTRLPKKNPYQVPCPLCGEPLDPEAAKCKNCGASVPKQTRESLTALMDGLMVDAQKAQRLYNLGYRKPQELRGKDLDEVLSQEPKLFLCPSCGAFVHEKDEKCQRCGAEFGGDAMEIEDFLVREERPCPHCGEPIHVDAAMCPACGKPVAEPKGVSLGSTYMCPSCGVTVLEGQKECEVCGQSLSATALIASKAMEIEAKACPKCGGTLDPETGICPFCSKEEKDEEGMEEIDQFLEHLSALPAGKGGPKPKEAPPPAARKPSMEEIEELIAPYKAPEPEKPPEEEIKAEAALEELEVEVKSLPKVKLLKPSYSKLVRAPAASRAVMESRGILAAAEFMLYATAVALSLQYFASKTGSAALEWALFIFFGAASGAALGATALLVADIRRAISRSLLPLLGTFVLLSVPLHWYGGVPVPSYADLALTVAGMALFMPAVLRRRGRFGWLGAWSGGSVVAMTLTPAYSLSVNLGGDLVSSVLWVSSAVLVFTGVAIAIEVRRSHRSIEVNLRQGEEDFRRRDFTKSVEDYDKAIEIARRSGEDSVATPWYSKGAALVVMGRYEEALKAIDEALRINPNNEVAWVNKGNALSRMNDYRGALKAFNAALRVNPRYEVAWNNKGNTLARLGRYTEALKCYELAIQIDSKYRGAWVNKGYVLAKMGEYDEAAKCAETVMKLSGVSVPA